MTMFSADLEAALSAHATQQSLSRDEALERIVSEWLRTHGFLGKTAQPSPEGSAPGAPQTANPEKPDPEYVQYPGYFKGDGSL